MRRSKHICLRCAEPLRRPSGNRLCGWCVEELERSAVKALAGNPSDRAHAIWYLREQAGYSAEVVAGALADIARGVSTDVVFDRLRGETQEVGAAT